MKKRMWLGCAVAIAFILALVVAFPTQAQQGFTDFWSAVVMHTTLEVQGAATFTGGTTTTGAGTFTTYVQGADLKATDDLDVTDDARITGTVTAGDVSATTSVVAGTYVQGADLKATDDLDITDDMRITGTVTAVDATFSSNVTQSNGNLTIADFFRITPQGTLTLTMNGWLTPTGTMQPIAAAGAVSIDGGSNIADQTTGSVLVLVNIGSQTITISETTGLVSAGNIALAAGDSATLQMVGTTWYQIGASNN